MRARINGNGYDPELQRLLYQQKIMASGETDTTIQEPKPQTLASSLERAMFGYIVPPSIQEKFPIFQGPTGTDIVQQAKREQIIPPKAKVTRVTATEEGWQIQYEQPTPTPKPEPTRPPKDTVEWLQRGWEGIQAPFRQAFFPTPKERFERMGLFPTRKPTYTGYLIGKVEQTQQWFREAPIKEQFMFTPMGKPEYRKPIVEPLAQGLEIAYVPIGAVRVVESIFKPVPTVTGAALETVLSPIPKTTIGPLVIGRGAFTTAPMTEYWEQTKEHPGLLVGEIFGEIALAQYVWGPAIEKVWGGIKKGAKIIYRKTPFYQRAMYKRVMGVSPLAKQVMPEEEVFRVLTKTKQGWTYQPLRTTTVETGKQAWKPTVFKKAAGFKPKHYPWTPPAPLKVVRDISRFVSSGKQALIVKQVVKQVPKTTFKQAAKTFTKQVAKQALVLSVPSLVRWKGAAYPPLYKPKQKRKTATLPKYPLTELLRLPKYPTIAEVTRQKQRVTPTPLTKITHLLKTTTKVTPKTVELPKIIQISVEKTTQDVGVTHTQILRQLQGEARLKHLRIRKARRRRKGKKPLLFGAWFLKYHPIPTPEQLIKKLGG